MSSEQFERDKLSFEQNCETMRSLNQIMWQVPIIAMTLTGGLWYAVGTLQGVSESTRVGLLAYVGLANIGLIFMINRVRDVIAFHLSKIKEFNPQGSVDAKPTSQRFWLSGDRAVCRAFSLLMGVAALISLGAAFAILVCGWTPVDP